MKAESLPRTARSRFAPLNALTRPKGTLSPSEEERERERGPFLETRFMVSGDLERAPNGSLALCTPERPHSPEGHSLPLRGGEGKGAGTVSGDEVHGKRRSYQQCGPAQAIRALRLNTFL